MNLKNQIEQVGDALVEVISQPQPTLGIDLDGCVDESPSFFNILTHVWPGDVIVITFRTDRVKAIADLEKNGIRYTDLVLAPSLKPRRKLLTREACRFTSTTSQRC